MLYDVLVLGAGVAGLNAAASLAKAGRRVAVIEARERVGGRIMTRHVAAAGTTATVPVELGAEFIHGLPEATWRLVREAGIDTYELDGGSLRFDGTQLKPADTQSAVQRVLHDMSAWLDARPGTDATFEEYLHRTHWEPVVRNAAIRYVEGFNAADHRRIGIAALARQQAAEEDIAAQRLFHVRSGYDSLPRYLRGLVERFDGALFLGKPATHVRWSRGGVAIGGSDAGGREFEFRGRQAVIALPLGVLQAGTVRIEPAPADRLATAGRMAMGTVIRIPMLFRSRFWREPQTLGRFPGLTRELEALSFLFTDHALPSTWWTSHPDATPLLTAWIGGPGAARLAHEPLVDAALQTLAALFRASPAELREELLSWHFHDWAADSFARGAYSYMPAGACDTAQLLSEPVADTLYFAGEHQAMGHWGTVHGALQSGTAAAESILSGGLP